MLLKVVLDVLRSLADISTGDWEKRSVCVVCHTLRCTGLPYARGSMEQYDAAFAFPTHEVDLMLQLALVAGRRQRILRIMRLHKRLHEFCDTTREDQRLEAVTVALERANIVEVEEVPASAA